MLNEAFILLFTMWGIIADILCFCAGGTVFILILCSSYITKNMDTTGFRIYVVCSFIVWCWIFSKLIVM